MTLLEKLSAEITLEAQPTNDGTEQNLNIDAVIWVKGLDGPQTSPMLVEIKEYGSKQIVDRGIQQLDEYMARTGIRYSLLISRSDHEMSCNSAHHGFVFAVGLSQFDELVSGESFFKELRHQRNKAAHGTD